MKSTFAKASDIVAEASKRLAPSPNDAALIKAARELGRAEAVEILQACIKSGRPELAAEFLRAKMTPAQAEREIIRRGWRKVLDQVEGRKA